GGRISRLRCKRSYPASPVRLMTSTSKQTAVSHHIANSEAGWAPRLVQEARVSELEAVLARQSPGSDSVDLEVERAALLAALNRRGEAQQAFIDILRRA